MLHNAATLPRIIVFTILFIVASATSVPFAHAASVYKVSGNGNTLYLGGTLHLLSANDYPLPVAYQTAYALSDIVTFETDMLAINSPHFAQKMVSQMSYRDGASLRQRVSPATFSRLTKHLVSRNMNIQDIEHFKPALMSITLSMLELRALGLTSEGVDAHFFTKATRDKKIISWLETPDEQLDALAQMGGSNEDEFINYSLDEIGSLPTVLQALKSQWRAGDLEAMRRDTIAAFKNDYPQIYESVLAARNQNWLPALSEYMDTPDVEFVLVGTLHLAGKDGLLSLLEKEGFVVDKLVIRE
ncbi:TraB/GumN family protein [Alteromonas sp. A079]|uniref:TraB/GumN family protein n=1 Tax=Alteromonas sp. A079 TaxID=3410268 RepID=UPI003BA0E855